MSFHEYIQSIDDESEDGSNDVNGHPSHIQEDTEAASRYDWQWEAQRRDRPLLEASQSEFWEISLRSVWFEKPIDHVKNDVVIAL